jgi:hypothetical protein
VTWKLHDFVGDSLVPHERVIHLVHIASAEIGTSSRWGRRIGFLLILSLLVVLTLIL